MMKTEYDDTIDTIDDMLQSDRQFMLPSDTQLANLLKSDPRWKYKKLGENTEYYEHGLITPEWIIEGYIRESTYITMA